MDVFGIFIAVSFIGLIVTLIVMNTIKKIKKAQEYKPKSEVATTRQQQPIQTVKTRLEANPDRNVSKDVSKSSSNTKTAYDTSLANPLNPTNVLLYASLLDDSSTSSSYRSCNNSSSSSYSDSSSSSSDSSSSSCSSDSSSW